MIHGWSCRRLRFAAAGSLSLWLATSVAAQCVTSWSLPGSMAGVGDDVRAVVRWDADGAGPKSAELVIGTFAGGSSSVLVWHAGAGQWQPLGGSMNGLVRCLHVHADGQLFVGGDYTTIAGVAVNGIARWTGGGWQALGEGVANPTWPGSVVEIESMANGVLAVGGFFLSAGGAAANCIATWDGNAWAELGGGTDGLVDALHTTAAGDLVVAGSFSQVGGQQHSKVALWNGSAWQQLGSGMPSHVDDIDSLRDGRLLGFSGSFVALFDGTDWTQLPPFDGYALAGLPLPNGDIVVGGILGTLVRWDGTEWQDLALAPHGVIYDLLWSDGGELVAVGQLSDANGAPLPPIRVLEARAAPRRLRTDRAAMARRFRLRRRGPAAS